MKPSQTATEALKNTPVIKTFGDQRALLSNVLLALVRKEMSATDATAIVGVIDAQCNSLNTEIKMMRLHIDAQKGSGKQVELARLGSAIVAGDEK